MKKTIDINFNRLRKIAYKNRIKILDMIYEGDSGHLGGALSAVDVLIMKMEKEKFLFFPKDMQWQLYMQNCMN